MEGNLKLKWRWASTASLAQGNTQILLTRSAAWNGWQLCTNTWVMKSISVQLTQLHIYVCLLVLLPIMTALAS